MKLIIAEIMDALDSQPPRPSRAWCAWRCRCRCRCRVTAPAVPAWAAEGLRRSDSLEVKVRALLAERRQRIGYERELGAAAAACR